MVKLEKWSKGTYYSCPHQEKGNSECISCIQNAEIRERELIGYQTSNATMTSTISCEICQAHIADLNHDTKKNEQDKIIVQVSECYFVNKERGNAKAVCSNCKDKYEKLILCPFCLQEKETLLDGNCCKQCSYGKNPQEIINKSQEYKNKILNTSFSSINQNNIPEGAVPGDSNNSSVSPNQTQASSKFNWKHPGIIGGLVIGAFAIVGLAIYFSTRKNKE